MSTELARTHHPALPRPGEPMVPLVIGASLLLLFGVLTGIALRDHLFVPAMDDGIARFCDWAVPAGMEDVYDAVAELGSVAVTTGITLLLIVWLTWRQRVPSAILALTAIAAVLLVEAAIRIHPSHLPQSPGDLANLVVGRGGWSETYPSGHTARIGLIAVLYPALVMGRPQIRWIAVAVILAGIIGIQRVHAGLHLGDEVIGGALLGWGVAAIALTCLPPALRRERATAAEDASVTVTGHRTP